MPQHDEKPYDIIEVWQITPHLSDSRYDSCVIRDWAEAMKYVRAYIDVFLEGVPEEDLRSGGASVKFELVKMALGDYLEIKENTF